MQNKEPNIAFWKYDLFPHVLWGKIVKIDGNHYYIEGYGNSYFVWDDFDPLHGLITILPESKCKEMISELIAIKNRKEELIQKLDKEALDLRHQLTRTYTYLINGWL